MVVKQLHVCVCAWLQLSIDEFPIINFLRIVVLYDFRPFFTDQTLTSMSSSQGQKSYVLMVNNISVYAQCMVLMILINKQLAKCMNL